MQVPSVLDRLIAAKTIPPIIAVFVEPGARQEEYSRNRGVARLHRHASWCRSSTSGIAPFPRPTTA